MKTAVIYWSGTGNTEQMAKAVAEGAGAELFNVSEFNGNISDYERIAFGCPSMGAEELEESEFEPFFAGVEASLSELERLEKSGNFAVSGYGASYITDFVFQCDLGPTGFTEVRQAVSFLCNRQGFASVISGDGATVPEFVFSDSLPQGPAEPPY